VTPPRSVTPPDGPRRRLPAWAVAEGPFGVRLFDVGVVALVIAVIEINVITGTAIASTGWANPPPPSAGS
jgi:hypothetical protein